MKTNLTAKLTMTALLSIPTVFVAFKVVSSLAALNTLLN